jgi:calcineurin-like phosphoesterase family protein
MDKEKIALTIEKLSLKENDILFIMGNFSSLSNRSKAMETIKKVVKDCGFTNIGVLLADDKANIKIKVITREEAKTIPGDLLEI